ncbi:MAG: AbrB/MazE/SpoVT family DNA-binding domain-containing protein [Bacilli bacterium]|nr:AbrB/MazE/SpoVT family DNA-binding domain-containing protein [Bacilli bacterium]
MIESPNKDGKCIFGVCKVGEKGQIVIPKEAREVFNIKPGDMLVMLGDINSGIAIVKTDVFSAVTYQVFKK